MNWITPEQVKKEATKEGPKPALNSSIRHWWQNASATFRECVAASEKHRLVSWPMCALCVKYVHVNRCDCRDCCVRKYTGCNLCLLTPYGMAQNAWHVFCAYPNLANYKKWHTAAHAEHRFLCKVRREME